MNEKLKSQSIKIKVHDKIVMEEKMVNKPYVYQIEIPSKYIKNGLLELKIVLENPATSPSEVGKSDKRKLGIGISDVYFRIKEH